MTAPVAVSTVVTTPPSSWADANSSRLPPAAPNSRNGSGGSALTPTVTPAWNGPEGGRSVMASGGRMSPPVSAGSLPVSATWADHVGGESGNSKLPTPSPGSTTRSARPWPSAVGSRSKAKNCSDGGVVAVGGTSSTGKPRAPSADSSTASSRAASNAGVPQP